MNLEKKDGENEAGKPKAAKQKPVLVYIFVLFTVAFGLILMSFFMHQRSNEQVLGELHSNVNAIEQLQDAIDENLRLEKELIAAQEQIDELNQQLKTRTDEVTRWKQESEENGYALVAMNNLYVLQQEYAATEYDSCQEVIERMEQGKMPVNLPSYPIWEGVSTTPQERYAQLKEAVESKLED